MPDDAYICGRLRWTKITRKARSCSTPHRNGLSEGWVEASGQPVDFVFVLYFKLLTK